jgi:hypothetical protein
MEWYNYLAGFLSGGFLANFVPHFVNGISGNRFPTPFSKPHGIGLSSPTLNVIWALINLLLSFLFYKLAGISMEKHLSLVIFFSGIATLSIFSSKQFSKKDKM